MSDTMTLAAETRDRAGKGASRELRRNGRVPAVIYGNNQDPHGIHVEEKLLVKALNTGFFTNSIVTIEVDGKSIRTLPKDVHFHPVNDRPLHVDFLRVSADSKVQVNLPLRFIDEEKAPGIRRGGVLNIVSYELEMVCEASSIPDDIEISLEGLEVGATILMSDLKLPKGVEPTAALDTTVATIVAPSALKSSEGDTTTAEDGGEAEEA